jgi:hypothetical protein
MILFYLSCVLVLLASACGQTFVPCNQVFRPDRATIHFFSRVLNEAEVEAAGEQTVFELNENDMQTLLPHLRRGDLLENTALSGYRAEGLFIFDGTNAVVLDNSLDDYGNVPRDYAIYRDYNPYYWDYRSMNYNNMLVPELLAPRSSWHGEHLPCAYVHIPTLQNLPGLQIPFQDQVYTISQAFRDWVDTSPAEEEGADQAYVADADAEIFVGAVY